jgi:hypothetical protein
MPPAFPGGIGDNDYFLMEPMGNPGQFDPSETETNG